MNDIKTEDGEPQTNPIKYGRALLAEESSEIIKMAMKAERFGPHHARRDGLTAQRGLEMEIGDVLAAIDYLAAAGGIDMENVFEQHLTKIRRLLDDDATDDEGRRLAPDLGKDINLPLLNAVMTAKTS